MHWLLLGILLLALILGPQLWVRHVLQRYNREAEDNFPGSGGALAQHLVNRLQLEGVRVEATALGDHYDPTERAVRLTLDKLESRSLTAIVTAAHEVGHAIQHQQGYGPFRWRQRLVGVAMTAQRLGSFLLFAAPVLGALTRAPALGAVTALSAVAVMTANLIVQLITLPVEWDASFRRALPILVQGGYISREQEPAARRILRACALTYVAAAAANLLNFWTWLRLLRR